MKVNLNYILYEGQFELDIVCIYKNLVEGITHICQLKDLIINIYIYDLRVCLSSAFSSGNMHNDITHLGERAKINER